MLLKKFLISFFSLSFCLSILANPFLSKKTWNERDKKYLEQEFTKNPESIFTYLEILKNKDWKNDDLIQKQWFLVFQLYKVLGERANAILLTLIKHPSWQIRLASLKAFALFQEKLPTEIRPLFFDPSLVIRSELLTIVRQKKQEKFFLDQIKKMPYDTQNYQLDKSFNYNKLPIIDEIAKLTNQGMQKI